MGDFFFGPEPIVWLQDLLEPIGPDPFRALSLIGDIWGLLFALGLVIWVWGRSTLYALVPLLAIEAVSYLLINHLAGIPRPTGEAVVKYETLSISAFPSGHTYLTVIVWGFLYRQGRIGLGVAVAMVAGVVLGRLFLGVHHLGDVVGGVVLGSAVVWAYGRAWPKLEDWLTRRSYVFYVIGACALVGATVLMLPFIGGNPRWYAAAGMIAAAGVALPVEYRWIRWRGSREPARARALCVAGGLLGILVAFYAQHGLPDAARVAIFGITAAATLWVFLVAPGTAARVRHER
ncbi:MAG: phosphatase PAP2 family protein [Gemmatimonadota bacterium]